MNRKFDRTTFAGSLVGDKRTRTTTRTTGSGSSSGSALPTANPNPIQYASFGGSGGRGVVPGSDDNFGIGASRTQFSDAFLPFLRQRLEDALEMYSNFALTPWLNLTADPQIVNPALKRALNDSGQLARVDTAVIGGGRVRVRIRIRF